MKIVCFCKASLLGLILYTLLPLCSQAAPKLSQDKVAGLAQAYVRAVSGPNAAAAFTSNSNITNAIPDDPNKQVKIMHYDADKAPDDLTNLNILTVLNNHPHEYWRVEQPEKIEVEVDDTTGWVKGYINFRTLGGNSKQPAGTAILKSRALKIAQDAIKSTGEPINNLQLNYIQEIQNNTINPESWDHEWYIDWLRTYQGIPYRRQGAGVFLSAETGEVISVRMPLGLIDPVTAMEKVTKDQAFAIAEAQMKAVNLSISDLLPALITKEIVPGNIFWQSGDAAHYTLQTHVVWNCHFGPSYDSFEVWVDTATGDVVGGYEIGSLGGGKNEPIPHFGHQLQYSDVKKNMVRM